MFREKKSLIKLCSLISKLFHNLVTIQLCNFIYFRKISVPAASIYLPLAHWLRYYHLLLIYCFYIIGGLNDYSFFLITLLYFYHLAITYIINFKQHFM